LWEDCRVKKILAGWTGLALLAAAAAMVPLVIRSCAGPALPESIGSLARVDLLSGEKAASMVDRLHGKTVATSASLIGLYRGPGGTATLYRTLYGSPSEAEMDDGRMALAIQRGGSAFEHFHRGVRGERTVSMCLGMGQVHFFFASGRSLYWLAADPPVAREAFEDLLNEL
jgi:hypothetical protein